MRTIYLVVAVFAVFALARADDVFVNSSSGADTNAGDAAGPFKTLAKGVDALRSNQGDRLFISGTFSETLSIAKSGVTVTGLGEAQIEGRPYGIVVYDGSTNGVTIENVLVRNCTYALYPAGWGHVFRRLRFLENVYGKVNWSDLATSRFVECDWVASNTVGVQVGGAREQAVVYERCTLYGNWRAFHLVGNQVNVVIRDCIVARNDIGFLFDTTPSNAPNLVTDYNLVFDNGGAGGPRNYVGMSAGAHDLQQQDPQFVNEAEYNLTLKATSPALNAGRDSLGNPVSLGSHEIGVVSSGSPSADVPFSSWISVNDGRPVTDPAAEVYLDTSGNLALRDGVARGVAVSPVIDQGAAGARVTRVDFRANEDLDQPSGSKKVIDSDDSTLIRTFRIRGDDATFDPMAASPAWLATTNRANLAGLRVRYLQLEFTLTRQGR